MGSLFIAQKVVYRKPRYGLIFKMKTKGIDDHKNHESGHKSEKAKAIYLRRIKRTESTK